MQGCHCEGGQLPLLEGALLNGSILFSTPTVAALPHRYACQRYHANEGSPEEGNWEERQGGRKASVATTTIGGGTVKLVATAAVVGVASSKTAAALCVSSARTKLETRDGGDGCGGRKRRRAYPVCVKTSPTARFPRSLQRSGRGDSLIFPGLLGRGTCWPYCVVPIFLLLWFDIERQIKHLSRLY